MYTRCRFSWPTIHRTKGLGTGTGREQVMTSVAAELRELRPLLRFACPRQREKGILKVFIPEREYGKKEWNSKDDRTPDEMMRSADDVCLSRDP